MGGRFTGLRQNTVGGGIADDEFSEPMIPPMGVVAKANGKGCVFLHAAIGAAAGSGIYSPVQRAIR